MDSEELKSILSITEKVMDFGFRMAGPAADEAGLLLAEKVRAYRIKNCITVAAKARRMLEEAGFSPNEIPPRLFLPIMEASSIEDDAELQALWAGLLASASQQADNLSPSFVETLKQLSPDEARFFDRLYSSRIKQPRPFYARRVTLSPFAFGGRAEAPHVSPDTFERLGLIRRIYGLTQEEGSSNAEKDVGYYFEVTDYAETFMRACHCELHLPPPVVPFDAKKEAAAIKEAMESQRR